MLLFVVGLLACGTPSPPTVPGGERGDIDVAGFAVAHADGAAVLDVRTPAEFADGHVPRAVNMPVQQLDPALPGFDASEPVYVICQSGGRSSKAADILAGHGWHAINVQGGTAAWKKAGHAVQ